MKHFKKLSQMSDLLSQNGAMFIWISTEKAFTLYGGMNWQERVYISWREDRKKIEADIPDLSTNRLDSLNIHNARNIGYCIYIHSKIVSEHSETRGD